VLGPWPPGRDPLGDALAAFAGAPGGPPALPWEAGVLYCASAGGGGADDGGLPDRVAGTPGGPDPAPESFPQPAALGAALLGAQLRLLGGLLAAVSPANQVHRPPRLPLTNNLTCHVSMSFLTILEAFVEVRPSVCSGGIGQAMCGSCLHFTCSQGLVHSLQQTDCTHCCFRACNTTRQPSWSCY